MNRNYKRQEQYEEVIILDKGYKRVKQIMDYPSEDLEPYASDGDFVHPIPLLMLADKQLDIYCVGVFCRLMLLHHFYRDPKEIYQFGKKEYIDKALKVLIDLEYIDNNLKILYKGI